MKKLDELMSRIDAQKRAKLGDLCVWCDEHGQDPHAHDPEQLGLCFGCGNVYKQLTNAHSKIVVNTPLVSKNVSSLIMKRAMNYFGYDYDIVHQRHSSGGRQHHYTIQIRG